MPSREQSNFEFHYGTIDFRAMEIVQQKFKYLDNFLFERKDKNPELTKYRGGLSFLIHNYLNERLKINNDLDYDLGKLDFVEFVERYEAMMAAIHKENHPDGTPERKPYLGKSRSAFVKDLKAFTQSYNKPLNEIWSDMIVKDQISFDEIKEVVAGNIQSINHFLDEKAKSKPNTIETQEFRNVLSRIGEASPSASFASLHMARLALDKAWKDRSVFWRIIHPIEAVQQYIYKKTWQSSKKATSTRESPTKKQ